MTWTPINTNSMDKEQSYRLAHSIMKSMIAHDSGIKLDDIAFMATLCSVLKETQDGIFWVGFYRVVDGNKLLIGPYQGTPGCLEIAFSRGICGRCARERRVIIVEDVNLEQDHIACDSRSVSEIVLPVFSSDGDLLAVFDLDSELPARFDSTDQKWLTLLLNLFFEKD